jgi:hypothetical protein
MAGEWRRASEAYGVTHSVADYGLHAPLPQGSVWEPVESSAKFAEVIPAEEPSFKLNEGRETTTDIDGTLSIGRWVVRLQLLIRRSRRD